MTEQENPLLAAALAYARIGWHVFPVEPPVAGVDTSGKRPIGALVPRGKDDATCTDYALIRSWWTARPDANVGIACEPSGLVVLDVDVAHGKRGRESLAEFDATLPDTLTAQTGSGGLHAVYQRPVDMLPPQMIGFRDGLDLIGKGYIVAAPSLHYSGGRYAWIRRVDVVPLPACLRDVRRPRAAVVADDLGSTPIAEGGRNNALFKLGASLRAVGIGRDALLAALHFENQRRFTPPLPDGEVLMVADSVLARVDVTRDVAAGAVAADDVRAMFSDEAPEPAAMWARDVAVRPSPPTRWISTGNKQLDELLGGGAATRQVVGVVGPPSVGKSAYITAWCLEAQREVPVLHVSTELPRRELMIRYAAAIRGWPWREGMRGSHDAELGEACATLRVKMIGVDTLDREDPISQIAREAMVLRDETGGVPPLIVIDYVQLLARGDAEGVRGRVGDLTRRIREMAQLLDCAILAVFSTSRGFYGGGRLEQLRAMDDPTVYLGAAKESGDIEFDCATILFLDVDQLHDGAAKPARAVVARCRMGDIGAAGYRARLDVGRWDPDPLACAEMSKTGAAERDAEDAATDIERQIRALVVKFPHMTWTNMREAIHAGSKPQRDAVKACMVSDTPPRLIEISEQYLDSLSRPMRRTVFCLPGNEVVAPAVVPGK